MAAGNKKFHPACTVRIQLRLEDYLPDVDDDVATEGLPFDQQLLTLTRLRARTQAELAGASRSRAGTAAKLRTKMGKLDQQIAQLKSSSPLARGTAEQTGDAYSVEFVTVPFEASAEINSYRALDSCKFSIPFRDAPLSSQDARSALVEVYLGTVSAEDFSTPSRWQLAIDRKNILFRGYVESWNTKHTEDDATVEVEARSLECLLHDAQLDPRASVFRIPKGGETISAFVNRVMANVPATSGRTGGDQLKAIFYRATAEPRLDETVLLRTLQTAKSRNAADPSAGGVIPDAPTGGTGPGQVNPAAEMRLPPAHAQDMRAWDLIVQACEIVGCVPVYDPALAARRPTNAGPATGADAQAIPQDFILIRPANTLYESVQGTQVRGGAADEFSRLLPASVDGSAALARSQVRFMVWGRNIGDLGTERKLGRVKAPAVEVVSYNPDAPPAERVLRATYPGRKVVTKKGAKGEGATNEVVRKIVHGVRSQAQLERIALGLYHAIGRNELTVEIETDDVSSYVDPADTTVANPDVLFLRSGTACRVLVAHRNDSSLNSPTLSPLSDIFGRNTDELRRLLLEQQGRYHPELGEFQRQAVVEEMVNRISTTIQSARRTDTFYVRTVKHTWSSEDGWSAHISLVNFLEIRALPKNISSDDEQLDQEQRISDVPQKTPAFVAQTRAVQSKGGVG